MFLCTSRGVKCDAHCKVCWSRPTFFANLQRIPVEDLCRRFASPLFVTIVRRRRSGGQVFFLCSQAVGIFVSHAFACIPYAAVSLHKEADPHTSKTFSVVCGSASVFATREQRGAAVRRDTKPCGNTGKHLARARQSSPGSSYGPLPYLCGLPLSRPPRPSAGITSGH